MKSYIKVIVVATALIMICGCEGLRDFLNGVRTLDAPTTCLVDGVRFSASPEKIPLQDWPVAYLRTYNKTVQFEYSRDLIGTKTYVTLDIDMKVDEEFEIGKEYECAGSIILSKTKYVATEGWIKFLDYNGVDEYSTSAYISAVFEFTAQSENGDIVQVTEGTIDELLVEHID